MEVKQLNFRVSLWPLSPSRFKINLSHNNGSVLFLHTRKLRIVFEAETQTGPTLTPTGFQSNYYIHYPALKADIFAFGTAANFRQER